MPKIPRDISGKDLSKLLSNYNYCITRKIGSHIRLTSNMRGFTHSITIPDHEPIKIGTLNNILKDIADYLKLEKTALINELFRS